MHSKDIEFAYVSAETVDVPIEGYDPKHFYFPCMVINRDIHHHEGEVYNLLTIVYNNNGKLRIEQVKDTDLIDAQEWRFNAYMDREEFGDDLDEMGDENGPVEGKARFFRLIVGEESRHFDVVEAMFA